MSPSLPLSCLLLPSSSYISDNKLGLLLKQWAGEDMRAKAGTKEKTKLLTVLNEDLDEADLKTVRTRGQIGFHSCTGA